MRRRDLVLGGLSLGIGGSVAGGWLALRQVDSRMGSRQGGSGLEPSSPAPSTSPSSTPPASVPVSTPTTVEVEGLSQPLFLPARRDERLLVISDMNGIYGSTVYDPEVDRAIRLVPIWDPDIVISGGDMVAGQNPRLTVEQMNAMWAAFDQHVAGPLRQAGLPHGFTIGNHDASSARSASGGFLFQTERDRASAFWQDPAHDPQLNFVDKTGFPFYYTFEHNGIFFLTWDASSNYIPPEQMEWAEAALASEKAQSARLRIAIGHLPLYAVAVGRNELGEVLLQADQKRALLEKYNVHTYISGHHHAYYPAHKGDLQLLHCGILGSGPRPLIDSPLPPRKTITVLDIDFEANQTFYTTYNMWTMELIDQGELPRYIAGVNGLVLRRDVEFEDLSAEEIATCRGKIGELCRDRA
jgi:hypothetical protein